MKMSTDQTDRAGVHAVGLIFTRLGWAFREQPTSDYGIDAQAEKLNTEGVPGGRLIGLQIKTGKSYFIRRGNDYVFYGKARHQAYWTNHSLPVFLILHDPDTGLTLWQRIETHLIEELSNGNWAIAIPEGQTLDESNARFFEAGIASDLTSMRRSRLAIDLPLIRQFAAEPSIFLRVEDWVNKTLNFRGAEAVFDEDPDAEDALEFDSCVAAYTIDYFMAVFFPWLDWTLHDYRSEDEGGGEVAVHVLSVEVSAVGKAAILLDDFYQTELPPFRPVREIIEIPDDREDEWDVRD